MRVIADSRFGECVELVAGDIRAVVAPALGMSLVHFSVGNGIVIGNQRVEEFLTHRKGLGPLILPHFNEVGYRPVVAIQEFPHLVHLHRLGIMDPFQHGIGRYASWLWTALDHESVCGVLDSTMRLGRYSLEELNGGEFSLRVTYGVHPAGLTVTFDVEGEEPVACGIHFYYNLFVRSQCTVEISAPEIGGSRIVDFLQGHGRVFTCTADGRGQAAVILRTPMYDFETRFTASGRPEDTFDSLVLFSPAGAPFVCIEPISYDTRGTNSKRKHCGQISLRPTERCE